MNSKIILLLPLISLASCQPSSHFDTILRGGSIYDGSGHDPVVADLAINADTIAAIGDLSHAKADTVIDAEGLAIAPGFINMLSWANESLIEDGRSQSEIRQGVTLEVMGEGTSDGPLSAEMKADRLRTQGDIKYDIPWTTLREFLDFLVSRGVSCNIASFVGATSIREHELGHANRPPTPEELGRMKALVRQAMEEGAVGLSTSLIYPPAFYAKTDEIIELAKVAAEYDGLYISHLRSEGGQIMTALGEFLEITRQTGIRSEIYHLKAAGRDNWPKLGQIIARIDSARAAGLTVTADMYTYSAAATGLGACFPPWTQEGGDTEWVKRLADKKMRSRIAGEIARPGTDWENFYNLAGTPDNILLVGFVKDSLKKYTGLSLTEVAAARNTDPVTAMMDLIVSNGQDIGCVYFLMSDDNVKRQIALPWMSFCSDSESLSPEGVFLKSNPHPRAYGSFARLLGKYVREEKVITLQEAVRRLSSLPAENLRIANRGMLKPGYFADVVAFNPDSIADRATFAKPHQFATGMVHVFVNGTQVLRDGEHTGAKPGRVVVRQEAGK
jgi:N-acyl-D-amino-acid deacylase